MRFIKQNCYFVVVDKRQKDLLKKNNVGLIDIGFNDKLKWPIVNKEYLQQENIEYVVQINGRKRANVKAEKDLNEESILNIAKNEKLLDKYLKNKSIKKIIFVKNRLINILLDE